MADNSKMSVENEGEQARQEKRTTQTSEEKKAALALLMGDTADVAFSVPLAPKPAADAPKQTVHVEPEVSPALNLDKVNSNDLPITKKQKGKKADPVLPVSEGAPVADDDVSESVRQAEQNTEFESAPEDPVLPEMPARPVASLSEELILDYLFVSSSEKRSNTLRITADNQQFFAQMGFLLGGGASAPDIIHNILIQFRARHELQIKKAMQKAMRQQLKM